MVTFTRWRRSALTLATTVAAGAALALSGSTAGAQPTADTADNTAHTDLVTSGTTISSDAWAAGRSKFGAKATPQQALQAYWTPARMRAAKPVEDTAAYEQALRKTPAQAPAAQSGPAQTVKPSAGGAIKTSAMPAAWDPNLPYWHPTARTSGKVFFSTPSGGSACSATIVNSEGRNTVWTAGHCVHPGNNNQSSWYWNWTFVPSYDDDLANPAPYGYWYSSYNVTPGSWFSSADFTSDMGVAIMATSGGWHIVDYFGGQGIQVNVGLGYQNAFGYPAEWPFDGGNLKNCGNWSNWETAQSYYIGCDMTRGSSGGGHLRGWDGNWGYLNGVNSRIDRIVNPTIMASPYFDNTAWDLYNFTRNR